MCSSDELLRLSDECRELSRAAGEFVLCRQLDELSRRYRRLAEQVARLETSSLRKPTLAA